MKEQNDESIIIASEIDKKSLEYRIERAKNWFISCFKSKLGSLSLSPAALPETGPNEDS